MSNKRTIFKEEAIRLVTFDQESQKYVVNEEAVEIIRAIPQPIGIVGVAGMYRTGKSYLLNRMLLNRSDGFGVGPTVNPCTKGLWIWGKPLMGQTPEGENCSILVIDSEGLGALDEDSTHDSKIFSLTILLSSCFIYNSVGSIDENAIQNLSLVVNLTKNIQIKASQQIGSDAVEDFSQYFPSFFWVVRDFTLQLIDQDNEPISSKEYLERALQVQKGFSDTVEQKNRIRRLIQTFFKERDCITLVRPLTNEENLQNLDKLDFEQLRPEFFEQVLQLRKRVLMRIKPKFLNGRNLSGAMYGDLIRCYVESINQGAVPAIESAWNYICRNECQKSIEEALQTYEQQLKELLHGKLPINGDDMKAHNKVAKDAALSVFKKRCIGDVGEEYAKELQRRMRIKFQIMKQENDREGSRSCVTFIQNEFVAIDRKLKLGEYRNFQDYERDIRLFYNYFMENGPKSQNRQTIILEYLQKTLIEGGHHIFKLMAQESEMIKQLGRDTQQKLEQDLKDTRAEGLKDKNNLLMRVNLIEGERAEVEMREQVLLINLDQLKQLNDKGEAELKNEISREKNDLQHQLHAYQDKFVNLEESSKDLERTTLFEKSEFTKEKALLQQKLAFFEKSLEDSYRKEKELTQELKSSKQQSTNQSKDSTTKIELLARQSHQRVSDLQEKLTETENDLRSKDVALEQELKRHDAKEKQQAHQHIEQGEQLQTLQRENRELRKQEEQWSEQKKADADTLTATLAQRLDATLDQLKYRDEQLKQSRNAAEKDRALMQQKVEFMEVQLSESRLQLDENRKAQEAIMKAFENSSQDNSHKSDTNKLAELRDHHKREIKQLEIDHDSQRKKSQQQIDQLTEKNNELELRVKFETGDLLQEVEQLKEQLQEVESHKMRLLEQNKTLDGQKLSLLKEQEQRYLVRIKQLEAFVEEADDKTAHELQAAQQKAEESLAQLKNFYEIERERLERRISEEKEKNDKRNQSASDEYYQKGKEQEQQYEEEIETLKDDLREQESTFQNMIQQYEHELALKQQSVETLEKYIKETKESLISVQHSNNQTLEQQLNAFTVERKGFIAKIDFQAAQINSLQKEQMSLQQRRDLLENEKQRKEDTFESLKKAWSEERQEFLNKIEASKSKLQMLNDEYLEKKISYGREFALVEQSNEFQRKKIDDQQKLIDNQSSLFEEKLIQQKSDYMSDLHEKLEKVSDERQQLEQKYERTKKALKETEFTSTRSIAEAERDKAIAQEKLANVDQKRLECESKLRDEISSSSQLQQQYREQLANDKKQLTLDVDTLKQSISQIEQDRNEIMNNYERDKALWDGKFQFLEQQKEQAKQDLVDSLRRFEMTLMHVQRARSNEKDEQESSVSDLILSVERKCQSQLDDAHQTHQRVVADYEDKLRVQCREIKQQKDQQMMVQHGKQGNQLLSEKKFSEMLDNEKRLQQEIDQVKNMRDIKMMEQQRQFEGERDTLKQKFQEYEQKYKDVESKRSTLIFEFEKERAKWNLDRDHLANLKNDLGDQLEKLERKKDFLLRENEKLKNEQKATRRSVNANNITSNLMTVNKYKPGGFNNVSGFGVQRNQHSPNHSSNTSTSSVNIPVKSLIAGLNVGYSYQNTNQNSLGDITNYGQESKSIPNGSFQVLSEDLINNSSFLDYKEDQKNTTHQDKGLE